ncbi:MAG: lipocalin-like domain-containing protein [Candidatus Rokubacteria bacterium]|nr:lipocalin-like domain-containing protein [Candidatus Rokubacteria bacterium]
MRTPVIRRLGLALLLAVVSVPVPGWAQDPLRGTWRLVSFDVVTSNGLILEQFLGPEPVGAIMYDGTRMCVQITRLDRRNFASNDLRSGTPTERAVAYQTFIAYCGTYTVNLAEGVVVHQLEFSLFPNWTGTAQKRFFEVSGDRLTLTTPPYPSGGGQVTSRLVWERAK